MASHFTSRDALKLLGVKPMQLYHWATLLGIAQTIGRGRRAVYTRKDVFLLLLCRRLYEDLGMSLREAIRVCGCVKPKIKAREHLVAESALRFLRIAWEARRTDKGSDDRHRCRVRAQPIEEPGVTPRPLYAREHAVVYVRVDDLVNAITAHA